MMILDDQADALMFVFLFDGLSLVELSFRQAARLRN